MSYFKKINKVMAESKHRNYDTWLDNFEDMEEFEDELEDLEQDNDKAKSALRTLESLVDSSAFHSGFNTDDSNEKQLYPETIKALRKEIKNAEDFFKGVKEAAKSYKFREIR